MTTPDLSLKPEGSTIEDLVRLGSGGPMGAEVSRLPHQLFQEVAARSPRRTAVVSGHARLSYAEVDARSNRLARRLRNEGVGPDSVVGIALPRRAEAVIAVLAVLKAG